MVAAVAFGAIAAATAGQTIGGLSQTGNDVTPLGGLGDAQAAFGVGGDSSVAPEILTVTRATDGTVEAQKLTNSERITAARAQRVAAEQAEAARPKFVKPADGSFTSGFGSRWGTTHYGVDIANRIGTPIRAVTDGVVIEAGPASGFGLWVRIQHADGTVTVYGHVDTYSVRQGQRVKAGEQIARMGNRGYSTGPHLHFEVWNQSGRKLNPVPWLAQRGISL